jgi:hypothetical protein
MIVAQTLTDQDADDPSQVAPLLDQIEDPIVRVTADGAYDGTPTYQTIAAHGDGIEVVAIPTPVAWSFCFDWGGFRTCLPHRITRGDARRPPNTADPFHGLWDGEIRPMLEVEPGLRPVIMCIVKNRPREAKPS